MKSAKQNTIRQSIDRHRITLIESKQRFTFHYYLLVLNKARHADDGYSAVIKLDPAYKINVG